MKSIRYIYISAVCFMLQEAFSTSFAQTLLIDSFDEGDFYLSLDGDIIKPIQVTTAMGDVRVSQLSNRYASEGTTMISDLSSESGTLSFFCDGQSNGSRPLSLGISYSDYPSGLNLSGYSYLKFDFTEVSGLGNITVEIDRPSDLNSQLARFAIKEPGFVYVPLDMAWGSEYLDSFSFLNITFEAASPTFSFTLAEITAVVPEPASCAFLLGASALLLTASRRRLIHGPG